MPRTWSVRLAAIRFTASVRSFQVPATSGTAAWPPSRPSVPTSRATRVTSSANSRSVAVSSLIVSASSATSPRAFTVIVRDRSPWAIAVAAEEIERTWLVRLLAIVFTESVSARQVPATPRTSAWPPSRPSVPTSRATRVTSSANEESWSTMVFTVRPIRRNSPRSGRPSISSAMCWDRSPSATASITRAISAVGASRSSITVFTARAPGRPGPVVGLLVEPGGHPALPADHPADPQQVAVAAARPWPTSSLNWSTTSPAWPGRRGSRTSSRPCRTCCSAVASSVSRASLGGVAVRRRRPRWRRRLGDVGGTSGTALDGTPGTSRGHEFSRPRPAVGHGGARSGPRVARQ